MELVNLIEDVSQKYFFKRCTSLEDIRICQKLRHKVYCEEKGWEETKEDMIETDVFDLGCLHILVVCRLTGVCVATFRLISDKSMPLIKYMPENHVLHPKNNPNESVCELSRFSVLKAHRGLALTTALMMFVGYEMSKLGCVGIFMVIEKSLARRMRKVNIASHQLTDEFQLNGKRAIYFCSSSDVLASIGSEVGFSKPDIDRAFSPLLDQHLTPIELVS